jgi:hypothetical protein
MTLSELKEKLEILMRETGRGSTPIGVLDGDTSDIFDINDIVWDEESKCFFIKIGITDE